jgi:uncharacterized membrane protein
MAQGTGVRRWDRSKTASALGLPRTVEELTQRNVELISQLEQAAMERRSPIERVIDRISSLCGSIPFLWFHVLWYGGWIAANALPGIPHFDPFPFQFLTLVVSLEAIFLSTFILITQNRHGIIAERRNHLDLQINLLSEQENTKMLLLLDRMARKLGIDECDDPEVRVLGQDADPERLIEQIEESMEQPEARKPEHDGPAEAKAA